MLTYFRSRRLSHRSYHFLAVARSGQTITILELSNVLSVAVTYQLSSLFIVGLVRFNLVRGPRGAALHDSGNLLQFVQHVAEKSLNGGIFLNASFVGTFGGSAVIVVAIRMAKFLKGANVVLLQTG